MANPQTPKKTPLNIVARMKAKPGCEEQLYRALDAMIAPTRSEAGCVNYDLYRALSDPSVFVLYEGVAERRGPRGAHAAPPLQSDGSSNCSMRETFEDGKPFKAEQLEMLSLRAD